LVAGVGCFYGVLAKHKFGYDDSLDAFGVHCVGGIIGAVLTGVFCRQRSFADLSDPVGADGLLYGGGKQFLVQVLASAVGLVFAAGMTFVLLKLVDRVFTLRVAPGDEREGLDTTQHGEEGYAG